MAEPGRCPHCEAELPPNSPEGLCVKCLYQAVLQDQGGRHLHVRCPHCHNPIELVDDSSLSDITCPSCDSSFSLVGDETITYRPDEQPTIGHFQLREKIGTGAFGTVWKALDTELDRIVAVKIPRKDQLDPKAAEQFFREARAAAQLKHENIVTVHEVGRDDGTIFIASDYVEGANLQEWLSGQRLTPREAAELCLKIAKALDHAHQRGVVHRDLKPGNIMLDLEGEPHIMDFGLAKRESGEITMTMDGQVLGTPAYMSPEQARGEGHQADGRTDIYSLGVILYELLTGELPFRGEKRMLIVQILKDEAPALRRIDSRVPRDLETICLKCLEKEPQKRYSSAQQLAKELQRFLNGEPIHARPISTPARAWRWCRRNPRVAAATALATLSLVAVTVVSIASTIYVSRAASRVKQEQQQTLRQLAENHLDRGLALCDQGDAGHGILWMARSLTVADADLQHAIRSNLAVWRHKVSPLREVLLYDDPITALAFSPDGSRVVTRGYERTGGDGTLQLWDVATGNRIGEPLAIQNLGQALALSPDGKTVLTGMRDGTARLWDMASGKAIGESFRHQGSVRAAAFRADGRAVLTGTIIINKREPENTTGHAYLWEVATGQQIGKPIELRGGVSVVAFSHDGATAVVGGNFGTTRILNAATWEPIGEPIDVGPYVQAVAFSPEGNTFLTGCGHEATVQRWYTKTRLLINPSAPLRYKRSVNAMSFSPDGKSVLTGSNDKTARLWDVASGDLLAGPLYHPHWVNSVAFCPDGKTLATVSSDNLARFWSTPTSKPFGVPLELRHAAPVSSAVFSPDGTIILIATNNNQSRKVEARLWDAVTGTTIGQPLKFQHAVWAVAFSPDGRTLLTLSNNISDPKNIRGECQLWDATNQTPVGRPLRHQHLVRAAVFSPDGKFVVTASYDHTARLWNAKTGKPIGKPLKHRGAVLAVAFSPNSRTLITGIEGTENDNLGGEAQLWDVATGERIKAPISHKRGVGAVAFSPDGKTVLTGSIDKKVRLWDVASGRPIGQPLQHHDAVHHVSFSADGATFLTKSGSTAQVWNAATGKPLGLPLQHQDPISVLSFSPDGKNVVTGSGLSVFLWDSATGRLIGEPLRRQGTVSTVAFSPDGSKIVTGGGHTTQVWDMPSPVMGDVERITLWTQVITGMELGPTGGVHVLDAQSWHERRRRLEELGGPPVP